MYILNQQTFNLWRTSKDIKSHCFHDFALFLLQLESFVHETVPDDTLFPIFRDLNDLLQDTEIVLSEDELTITTKGFGYVYSSILEKCESTQFETQEEICNKMKTLHSKGLGILPFDLDFSLMLLYTATIESEHKKLKKEYTKLSEGVAFVKKFLRN